METSSAYSNWFIILDELRLRRIFTLFQAKRVQAATKIL